MTTLIEHARTALADDLPTVPGPLLDRYAELVCTTGSRVTEHLVADEWEVHHAEMPLALDQRPEDVQRDIAAATAVIRSVAEQLAVLVEAADAASVDAAEGFVAGHVYRHPEQGWAYVAVVADVPPGWHYEAGVGPVPFGFHRPAGAAPGEHELRFFVGLSFEGWQLVDGDA